MKSVEFNKAELLNLIKESTGSSGGGSYRKPLNLVAQIWEKDQLGPFTIPVSKYVSADLAYDSYDGEMERSKSEIKKEESRSIRLAKQAKKSFNQNDDEGNPINGYSPSGSNQSGTPDYIKKQANLPKSSYENVLVNEDLGVWFGTKKKPKGSKQPKGPWVNICRKKEGGGHPPCGRPDASDKGYPKCRAAGVAAKMSDSQKKSACAQKRKAEKSHDKSGTGNKPKMVSYKPKKESIEEIVRLTLKKLLS